jgi:group I intron endonuclease
MDINASGIYKIQSKAKSDRIYIGSTINIKKRWRSHLLKLRAGKHPNPLLQKHFIKYKESDLVFFVIELCFPEFLIPREQYYIDKLKPSFNICTKAGSTLGVKHSVETRIRVSEGHKGQIPWNKGKTGIYSEETRKKIGDAGKGRTSAMKGKNHTEEARRKMSLAKKGKPSPFRGKARKPLTEGHKQKLRGNKFASGRRTEEQKQRMREAALKNGSKPPSRLGAKVLPDTIKKVKETWRLKKLKAA